MKQNLQQLNQLYAITDYEHLNHEQIIDVTKTIIAAGVEIIQYRNKNASYDEQLKQAISLRNICDENNCLLIINDDINLAINTDADGLHIGKHDFSIQQAREKLPEKIIGVSCYNELQRAIDAEQQSADYVAFGAIFSTKTKEDTVHAPIELLTEAKTKLQIPIVAIGGITTDNVSKVFSAGADMVAAISGIYLDSDPYSAAKKYLSTAD